MKRQSFEQFYLSKMALGEGCGCAELVSRTRDVEDDLAAARRSGPKLRLFSWIWRRRKRAEPPQGDGSGAEGAGG